MLPTLSSHVFGQTWNGKTVTLYKLSISNSLSVSVMDYGATLTHLFVPDRDGKIEDVVLGFDEFSGYTQQEYLSNYCYLGSTVGRVAGRFTENKFDLNGKTYSLPPNQNGIHLHGGVEGWDKKLWTAKTFQTADAVGVTFYLLSKDLEENYPGNLEVWVTYTLHVGGTLEISYKASTDQPTVVNPTNHSYFNLSGNFAKSIEDHEFWVDAANYLPMNERSLPTGEVEPVSATPFDFQKPKLISEALHQQNTQLAIAGGVDHCFVLNQSNACAVLFHKGSGRKLTLSTTEPGLQVYTSNYLNKAFSGKGVSFDKGAAICLETQHFPDSPNHANFPSIQLMPGDAFESTTKFAFSVA